MARRKALLFSDVARFVDYVRLGSPKSSSTKGFELIEVTWPTTDQRGLVLLGHRARPWSLMQRISRVFRSEPGEAFDRIEVIASDEALIWQDSGKPRPLTIHSRRGAHELIDLVALQPWRSPPESGPVIFRSSNIASMERLALSSLSLDNDRIQVAAMAGGDLLLKIESPSWFLLEGCLEEVSADITLFTPMPGAGGQAWLRWGWAHPMARMWGAILEPGAVLLFSPDSGRQELVSPDWQDIYDTSEVVLGVSADAIKLEAVEVTDRFTITVHLAPRARPADAELWLVEGGDRRELERLLTALDDTDLDDLLVAPIPAPDGTVRYLIRERHTGSGRKFIDFSPRGFAPWSGVPDLLIPADQTLLPHLRRDRYRALFSLKPGWLTLLLAPGELIQVAQSAFVPLSRLVDYQISAEVDRIEPLMARNLFEFAPYTSATSRPDLLARRRTERTARSPTEAAPAEEPPTASPTDPTPKSKAKKPVEKPTTAAPLSEQARQERDLEREIIEEPTTDRWHDLAALKTQRGEIRSAFRCCVESWWLAPAKVDEEHHGHTLAALVDAVELKGPPASQARQALQKNHLDAALAYVLLGRSLPTGQIDSWVLQSARLLSHYQSDLPKKVRWLAWGEVWKANQDVRAQASVRTQILSELDAVGLSPMDVPDFLQERLLKERSLTSDQDAGEITRAMTNLEGIHAAIRKLPPELRCGGMAVLARAYRRLDRPDRTSLCMEQARLEHPSAFVTAWVRLFAEEGATDSKSHISLLLADLPRYEATAMREVAASLHARREEESPLSFLSADNINRLYPTTPSLTNNPLYARLDKITDYRKRGNVKAFVEAIKKWLGDAVPYTAGLNSRDISTLVHLAVREISRMQSSKQGTSLVIDFNTFSKQALATVGKRSDYFAMLLQLSLAQGAIDLHQTSGGLKILSTTMANLQSADCITLDLVDVCSAAIQVLESADFAQRGGALNRLLGALVHQCGVLPDLASTSNTLSVLRLLDQLCEASVSKDRLTLGRYRRYQDLDELQIRERVLTEDHCI